MPLQATSGAASYDAFGGGVPVVPNYIEEVFSTYLYTGNAGTQTVTNGIDLSTKGGMVWIKSRSGAFPHSILDTVRGFNYSGTQTKRLDPSTTDNEADAAGNATQASPLTDGFSVTTSGGGAINFYNGSGSTYASWTFREQPKFFDVLTYTGTGSVQNIAHNLGSAPGCIIVKKTSSGEATDWGVYHRGIGATRKLNLNTNAASALSTGYWNNTEPTSTVFTVATSGITNESGATYIAYLFAHDAGGFGLTGTDNVISCGSFTAGNTVNLGYEPQWLLVKQSNGTAPWELIDNMRGFFAPPSTDTKYLVANTSAEEQPWGGEYFPTATGFKAGYSSGTFIYIAIRRGPMKVPTSGTSVFSPVNQAGGGTVTTNFPVDLNINTAKSLTIDKYAFSRLTSPANYLNTNLTAAETAGGANFILFDRQNSIEDDFWGSGNSIIYWNFRRAPSFFDEVCYTGTGSARTLTHNLAAVPEMMIVKARNVGGFSAATYAWQVYHQSTAAGMGPSKYMVLNSTAAESSGSDRWNNTAPTSSVFTVGNAPEVNESSSVNYVAYLFATCAGVSKVGAYTGNGSTQTIDCGFGAGGARFVLIKRTDSTGDWYVYDTARGMTVLTDPYLLVNSTAVETATLGSVTTVSTGFALNATVLAAINTNAASYIFLAIA